MTVIKSDEKFVVQCASDDGDQLAVLYYKDECSFVFEFLGTGAIVHREAAYELATWMQIALKREEVREWNDGLAADDPAKISNLS